MVYDPKPGEDPRNKLARIALPPLWIHSCHNCVLNQKLEIAGSLESLKANYTILQSCDTIVAIHALSCSNAWSHDEYYIDTMAVEPI